MKVKCSRCGEDIELTAILEMYDAGYRAVGDAIYCPTCVQGWNERAGIPFDKMFKSRSLWGAFWWRQVGEKSPWMLRQERKRNDK